MSHGRFRMTDGDWVCSDPECGNVNFARRTSCNRCKKDKPVRSLKNKLGIEIGKAAAERSHGLFSAEDWQCTKCGNINWARRNTCNMCNSPRVGDLEERTGYGGGFNERENVEYIHRDESDGEYDEFGRKKKKYRRQNDEAHGSDKSDQKKDDNIDAKTKTEATLDTEEEKEKEEKNLEEEDDDDDEDVSKYDLSGWGDDEETNNDSKEHEVNDGGDCQVENKEMTQNEETSGSRSRAVTKSENDEVIRARSRSPIEKS